MRRALVLAVLSIAMTGQSAAAKAPSRSRDFAAMGLAKSICSAVFVSGREPREALETSALKYVPARLLRRLLSGARGTRWSLDREHRSVSVAVDGFRAVAGFFGSQGCVLLPEVDGVYGKGSALRRLFFTPKTVTTSLPDPEDLPWPMGDAVDASPEAGVDAARLERAVAAAFADGAHTVAFVVLHHGRIVAERYDAGTTRETLIESWSFGKSLLATLVGVMVQRGELGLRDPVGLVEWQSDPADPRREIEVRHLMQMSSGLRCSGLGQPAAEWERAVPDHFYVTAGAIDAHRFAVSRPADAAPDEVALYRNCDVLVLGALLQRKIEAAGRDYFAWPQRDLFDELGIRKLIVEPDPYGNLLFSSHVYAAARDWMRIALLYLNDGMWQQERLLPAGFGEFVGTPAAAWRSRKLGDRALGRYGAMFWSNSDGTWSELPRSSYYMVGTGGQRLFIVPDRELAILRMGRPAGQTEGLLALQESLELLMPALGPR